MAQKQLTQRGITRRENAARAKKPFSESGLTWGDYNKMSPHSKGLYSIEKSKSPIEWTNAMTERKRINAGVRAQNVEEIKWIGPIVLTILLIFLLIGPTSAMLNSIMALFTGFPWYVFVGAIIIFVILLGKPKKRYNFNR